MRDREGLVINCQTAVTMNDSRLAVHCSVLCLICKPNPSYTKIWGHVSMGITRTKYPSCYTSLGNRVTKGAERTVMRHVFETDSITDKLQATTAFAQGREPSVPTQEQASPNVPLVYAAVLNFPTIFSIPLRKFGDSTFTTCSFHIFTVHC
jgi:hypothetical protein